MAEKMVKCPCGWSYSSDRDDDLVSEVQKHARDVHSMEASREEVLAMAQPG